MDLWIEPTGVGSRPDVLCELEDERTVEAELGIVVDIKEEGFTVVEVRPEVAPETTELTGAGITVGDVDAAGIVGNVEGIADSVGVGRGDVDPPKVQTPSVPRGICYHCSEMNSEDDKK